MESLNNGWEFTPEWNEAFARGEGTAEDVRLMRETVGDAVKVKASGGIRDWAACRAMIEAGAERIGASAGKKILDEFMELGR